MDLQIASFHRAIWLICLAVFLGSPLESRAQEGAEEFVPGSVRISVGAETKIWVRGKPATVTVKIINNSDRRVELLGRYTFILREVSARYPLYLSRVDIVNGFPLRQPLAGESVKERVTARELVERTIHLDPGETKAVGFDLSKLFWVEFMPSKWRYRELEAVPTGRYDLGFGIDLRSRKDSSNNLISTSIGSNKVGIVVE